MFRLYSDEKCPASELAHLLLIMCQNKQEKKIVQGID